MLESLKKVVIVEAIILEEVVYESVSNVVEVKVCQKLVYMHFLVFEVPNQAVQGVGLYLYFGRSLVLARRMPFILRLKQKSPLLPISGLLGPCLTLEFVLINKGEVLAQLKHLFDAWYYPFIVQDFYQFVGQQAVG